MGKRRSSSSSSSSRSSARPRSGAGVLRFAHPFVTPTPIVARAVRPGIGRRMIDFVDRRLEPVPKSKGDAVMTLAEVIGQTGADQIAATGEITFLTTGDTGRGGDSPQEEVSDAMSRDFDAAHPERSPALLYHLGDVIYGHRKALLYRDQFYVPYRHFPGKIVAIPGNHDGETYPTTDTKSLKA